MKAKIRWTNDGNPTHKLEAFISLGNRQYEVENVEDFIVSYLKWKEIPLVKIDRFYGTHTYYPSKLYSEANYMEVIQQLKEISQKTETGGMSENDMIDKIKKIVEIAETPPVAIA